MTSLDPMSTTAPWQVLTCNNPSPMTLEGTNTYLLGAAGADDVVVVDPGPADHPEHLQAILDAASRRSVQQILITHRHADHLGAAAALADLSGAPVRSFDPELCRSPRPGGGEARNSSPAPLRDGERITAGGVDIEVLHTPGHTADSVCFWLPQHRVMLTGDTILGRGTSMVDYPDGTLADYFATLARLQSYGDVPLLPGHGSQQPDLAAAAARYEAQRRQRLNELHELLKQHPKHTPAQLAELIYGPRSGVQEHVILQLINAQLDYLNSDYLNS